MFIYYPHCFLSSAKGGISSNIPAVLEPALGWLAGKEGHTHTRVLLTSYSCSGGLCAGNQETFPQGRSLWKCPVWFSPHWAQWRAHVSPLWTSKHNLKIRGDLKRRWWFLFLGVNYLLEKGRRSRCNLFKYGHCLASSYVLLRRKNQNIRSLGQL